MSQTQAKHLFVFGCYRLQAGTGLTCGDKSVPLAPKELGVLESLVKRCGQLASKEELINEVWPDEVASDESLTRCIYVLRQRLAEGLENPIATVHRRGYRFAVPVKTMTHGTKPQSVLERSVQTSATAHLAYLEGRQHSRMGTPAALESAIAFYEEATKVDPHYAVPLVAIADCRIHQCVRGLIAPLVAAPLIRAACERALSLDPLLASAHAALGWVRGAIEWRHEEAVRSLDRAIELDSEYPLAFHYRAWVLRGLGRHDEAINDLRITCHLDPYVYIHQVTFIYTLFLAGRHADALALAKSISLTYPALGTAHAYLCSIAAFLGEREQSLEAGHRAAELTRRDPTVLTSLAYAFAAASLRKEAHEVLDEVEARADAVAKSLLYPVYAALGATERADFWLSRAKDDHCPWLMGSLSDPRLGPYKHRASELIHS